MGDQNGRGSQSGSENEDSMNKGIEGTAARTRPCSIEDIIFKRSKKMLIQDAKEGSLKVRSDSVKSDLEAMHKDMKNNADHGEDPVLESAHPKRKIPLDKEPFYKDTSSRREQKHSAKNDGSLKRVERHSHDARMSKIKLQEDVENSGPIIESSKTSSKDKKSERRGHHRSRGDGEGRPSDYGPEKSKEQIKVKKDRMKEKDMRRPKMEREGQRKYEDGRDEKRKIEDDRVGGREGKRKREDERDEKRMKENDRVRKRKHGDKSHIADKIERRQDDDYYERKDRWKESSHSSRQYEAKGKRSKRSLSPEHKKAKDRGRSSSPSPRSSKRLYSNHKKDLDRDQSSHRLSVERSEKDCDEQNEKEKGGASVSQGGSNWRYSGGISISGIGGYSPRRRRSETAVKTPSPPAHLPERKPAWDLTPGGMDSNMVAAMVAAYQASTQQISSSSNATALSTISLGTSNSQKSNVSASSFVPSVFQQVNPFVDTVELTQSTRPSRRLSLANLPSSISDGELTEFLNSALLSASANHLPGTKPCISCVVSGDKSHAVAEFLTPEDATAALLLDGTALHGNNLIIKRPKDFVEAANGDPEKSLPAADLISSVVTDSPHKIFIGGISHTLDSDKVREIVTAFGELKAYHLEVDTNRKPPESFAFLEYVDSSVTLKACVGLNGMRLGGRVITVVQATPDASGEGGSIPFYGIPEHAKPLMQKPTRVLELKNVLTKEELLQLSEVELEEISEDVRIECTRFGAVKSLNIVRWNRSETDISITSNVGQNQGGNITSTQGKENGNPQKSFPDVAGSENLSKSLDQQNKVVEDIMENGREPMDVVVDPNDDPVQEDKECDENDVANKLDASGGASDGNALQNANLTSQDKEEHGNASIINEVAFAVKALDQSVDALNLGKHSLAGDLVQQERDEGQKACLDTVNHPVSVVATKEDGETLTDCELLEVGSILIEFSREEATCLAAHTLHGRLYGSRNVIASYFPHSVYQKIFPRGNVR